jgi:serine/threonine protein kinase
MSTSFEFPKGYPLADGKYEIVNRLGGGWESEVYKIKETMTGIDRAAKFFFPKRNLKNKTLKFYAKKLHKLRHCNVVIRYLTQEKMTQEGEEIFYMISDYVEGETLHEFLSWQKGKRIGVFQGLHLLHALAIGIQEIHNLNEYHGDLHTENIMIEREGLSFDLKILDMFHWKAPRSENIQDDVVNMIRVFYDAIGGAKTYSKHPQAVKDIICGLKRSLILKKFKTAGQLRMYLENMEWY